MPEDTLHTWRREQLVAEVQRLRLGLHPALTIAHKERIAALEEALRALVDDVEQPGYWDRDGDLRCCFCDAYTDPDHWKHEPDCPVQKARELLKGVE